MLVLNIDPLQTWWILKPGDTDQNNIFQHLDCSLSFGANSGSGQCQNLAMKLCYHVLPLCESPRRMSDQKRSLGLLSPADPTAGQFKNQTKHWVNLPYTSNPITANSCKLEMSWAQTFVQVGNPDFNFQEAKSSRKQQRAQWRPDWKPIFEFESM